MLRIALQTLTGIMNLGCILAWIFAWSVVEPSLVLAQAATAIAPTTGAGDLGTRVTTHGHTTEITGGSRPGDGTNLFHSFEQFKVGNPDTAKFLNTTPSLQTSNILSRVTGGSPSSIFGTIDTMSYPGANLFLMNPAGIVFGPTATLNVGGSVAFTTADYLRLAGANGLNAGIFHADPTTTSLLTSAAVAAFGFLGSDSEAIAVQGSMLTAQPGQSISLVGGNHGFTYTNTASGASVSVPDGVSVTGGHLRAPGGQINITSAASPGEFLAGTFDQAPNINGQSFRGLDTLQISEQSSIDTSGEGAGTIHIRGGRLTIDSSKISASTGDVSLDASSILIKNNAEVGTSTATEANSGHVTLMASGDIGIDSFAFVATSASPGSSGHAGNIVFNSSHGNVKLTNTAQVISYTETNSSGNTGSITVEAPHGDISLVDSSQIFNSASGVGTLGEIQIKAHTMRLETSSTIGVENTSTGTQKPGDTKITLDGRLSLTGGSFINTTARTSLDSGDLIIRALEVFITGKNSAGTSSGLYNNTLSSGDGGRLRLFTDNLQLMDGGRLFSKSSIGDDKTIPSGHSGEISIEGYRNPGTSVIIDGPGSGIFTNAEGTGAAGDISVKAISVTLQNGGNISAETTGTSSKATGGSINVTATDQMALTNGASITASTSGPGNAGSILVKADNIALSGGSTITASSTGSGNAGAVTIQGLQSPSKSFFIEGVNSGVFTKTTKTGAGGDITVSSNSVLIRNEGRISGETSGSSATATGGKIHVDGGQIRIESGALVTSSSAGVGLGGNISLTAGQSVTIQDGASVSASSTGPGNAGNISINAGRQLDARDSPNAITTQAVKASGGNISIKAINSIRFANSTISASVGADIGNGGNITIDPKTVVLQNAQILANAQQGNGGNITITTPVFLQDQASRVDASSQFGVNGTVTIQSPISNLSGTVKQLTTKPSEAQALLQNRCVALAGGEQSTFIVTGRDVLPAEPGGWLNSALSMDHLRGHDAEHATAPTAKSVEPSGSPAMITPMREPRALSLRRLTPPGFLVRTFGIDGLTGCRS